MSIRSLVHISYREYLKAEHWKETRQAAIERAGSRCALCTYQGDQVDVHHRTYERLGEELPEDLAVLCHDCHEAYELGLQIQGGVSS